MVQDKFSKVPFNQHLGLQLIGRSPESASVTIEPRSEFLQEQGIIHGAVLTALAIPLSIPFIPIFR